MTAAKDLKSLLGEGPIHPGKPGIRRRILIVPENGHARGDLEDDFHHFIIEIDHDGETITSVETQAPRPPWTTCPSAGPFLGDKLKGTKLDEASTFDVQLSHCTHLYDLALVTAAHARDDHPTLFSMFQSDPIDGKCRAEMYRNGVLELAWDLDGQTILPPSAMAGKNLRQLKHWVKELTPQQQEAALLLRRVVFISGGRYYDYSSIKNAAQVPGQEGACFTFNRERAPFGTPTVGTKWDFTNRADPPLTARIAQVVDPH